MCCIEYEDLSTSYSALDAALDSLMSLYRKNICCRDGCGPSSKFLLLHGQLKAASAKFDDQRGSRSCTRQQTNWENNHSSPSYPGSTFPWLDSPLCLPAAPEGDTPDIVQSSMWPCCPISKKLIFVFTGCMHMKDLWMC